MTNYSMTQWRDMGMLCRSEEDAKNMNKEMDRMMQYIADEIDKDIIEEFIYELNNEDKPKL